MLTCYSTDQRASDLLCNMCKCRKMEEDGTAGYYEQGLCFIPGALISLILSNSIWHIWWILLHGWEGGGEGDGGGVHTVRVQLHWVRQISHSSEIPVPEASKQFFYFHSFCSLWIRIHMEKYHLVRFWISRQLYEIRISALWSLYHIRLYITVFSVWP